MITLFRGFGMLLLTLLALTVGAVGVGRAAPAGNPLRTLGLDLCGDKPCLMGIVPAQSAWAEVQQRIRPDLKVSFLEEDSVLIAESHTNDHMYIFYPDVLGAGAKGVNKVSFKASTEFPLTGDLMLMFGPPCNFLIESDQYASLTYPNMIVFIRFMGARVSVFSPVSSISIVSRELTVKCYPDRWRMWAGFKGVDGYKARWPARARCQDCSVTAR
jgi:hypothetical protein